MLSFLLFLSLAAQPLAVQNFFTIIGSVKDVNGRSIPSIRVSLEDENTQPIRTVFADASGRFQFRGLRAGSYRVRVETQGLPYEAVSIPVDLTSMTNSRVNPSRTEDATPVDIVLRRKKSPAGSTPSTVFSQTIPPPALEEFNRAASIISKDPAAGILALQKATEIFPDYFDALDLLGSQYVKLGQFENATPVLMRALAVNGKGASSMYSLGVAFLKLKRFPESIEWLQKAAEIDAGNPNVFMMLGLALGNNNSLDESEAALKTAYQLGGASAADAHLYLGALYNKRERYGDAAREFELYLKEAKGLKDPTQIKDLIAKMKAKAKDKQ
jgi:uncharacterized protein HemY